MIDRAFHEGSADAECAALLLVRSGHSRPQFLRSLIGLAQSRALPRVSNYRVGAVGLGGSGAIYLGANIELASRELCHTIHAEQAVVVNAMMHGEQSLEALAISAAPCGSCRQFLRELDCASRLEIWLEDDDPHTLDEFLPSSFGPEDLGVTGALLANGSQIIESESSQPGANSPSAVAVQAALASYAPYTDARAGCSLVLADDTVFAGSYIENAAFNPSISAVQAALVMIAMAGRRAEDITQAVIAQSEPSPIDHAQAGRDLLGAAGCRVEPDIIGLG